MQQPIKYTALRIKAPCTLRVFYSTQEERRGAKEGVEICGYICADRLCNCLSKFGVERFVQFLEKEEVEM